MLQKKLLIVLFLVILVICEAKNVNKKHKASKKTHAKKAKSNVSPAEKFLFNFVIGGGGGGGQSPPTQPSGEDICLDLKGKKSWQSSLDYNAPSQRAIDGNRNQNFWANSCTHTKSSPSQWAVEFGQLYTFSKVHIWNRKDCCTERLNNFFIYTSNEPTVNTISPMSGMVECYHYQTTGVVPGYFDITLPKECSGRVAMIKLENGNTPLTLCEVEFCTGPKPARSPLYYYKFDKIPASTGHDSAVAYCKRKGGKLAKILNQEELKLVKALKPTLVGYYIDYKKTDNAWSASDGSTTEGNLFGPGQPDGSGPCGQLWSGVSYSFDDFLCNSASNGAICEFDKPFVDPVPCKCSASGDPHFQTFDGQWIHYYGICKYTLVHYSGDNKQCNFDVEIKNERRYGNPGPSYVRLVDIKIHNTVFRLHQGRRLYVDGQLTPAPYNNDLVSIYYSGNVIQFNSIECDVMVSYDGNHYVAVTVSGLFRNQLSGMCGNCDGQQNDYKTRDGTDVSGKPQAYNLIGDSYMVKDDSDIPLDACQPAPPIPDRICANPDDEKLIKGPKFCGIDNGAPGVFLQCVKSGKVNVEQWKVSCETDLCFNALDVKILNKVKCEILKALVENCYEVGFTGIDWRNFYNCPMTCPSNMEYSIRANPCPITCDENRNGIIVKECPDHTVREGCQCAVGFFAQQTNCVPAAQCIKGVVVPPLPPSDPQCINIIGRDSWQDSTGWGGPASRANDGNKNQLWGGNSCSHTSDAGAHWWAVRFDEESSFNTTRIYNRIDMGTDRMNNLTVYVSPNFEFDAANPLDGMTKCSSWYTEAKVPKIIDIHSATPCKGVIALIYMDNKNQPLHPCEIEFCTRAKERQVTYYKYDLQLTRGSANLFCWMRKGRVAKVYTEDEQKSVEGIGLTGYGYYFDLKYSSSTDFKYTDNSVPTKYLNWGTNKQIPTATGDYCSMFYGAEIWKWNAVECNKKMGVVCEFDEFYKEQPPCTCSASGDPHFFTFDGQWVHFYGICKYTLARYTENNECKFDVEIKNERRFGNPGPSYVRLVDVKIFGKTFRLHQSRKLYVDGELQSVPYELPDKVSVFYSGAVLQFVAPGCDLWVSYDGVSNTVVKTNGLYRGLLSGMCGNCDGQPNDYRTKDGTDVSSDPQHYNLIGDSWQTIDDSDLNDAVCKPAEPQPPDVCGTPENKAYVQDAKVCGFKKVNFLLACINSGKFKIEAYEESCNADVCLNLIDKTVAETVKCQMVKSLVENCNYHGFTSIDWRGFYNCPMQCGEDKKYSVAMNPCPLTCEDLTNGLTTKVCPGLPLREGCECKPGLVLQGNLCVKQETCKPGNPPPPPNGRKEPCKCSASGDPHFLTTDGQWIHYYGICKYNLMSYQGDDDECSFKIEIKNERRYNNPGPSYVRMVDVKMFGRVFRLQLDRKFQVDSVDTAVPFELDSRAKVFYSGNLLQFGSEKCDVWVAYDGVSLTTVQVNGRYAGNLRGMCGNCDGIQNDYRTKDGLDVSKDPAMFNLIGDSWQVNDDSDLPSAVCKPADPVPAEICAAGDKEAVKDKKSCGIDQAAVEIPKLSDCLKSGKVDIKEWKVSCEADLCFNVKDAEKKNLVRCEILRALVELCSQEGFTGIDWRTYYDCPYQCVAGKTYTPEMDPCPLSCEDIANSKTKATCPLLPRREGCSCAPGQVTKGDGCVKQESCKPGEPLPPIEVPVKPEEPPVGPVVPPFKPEPGSPCKCSATGDPHYQTFDGQMIHYFGTCKYTLAAYDDGGDCSFKIETKNENRNNNPGPSYVRLVDIKIHKNVYRLHQEKKFSVNGKETAVPFNTEDPNVSVFFSGNLLQFVSQKCDVSVSFDGVSNSFVQVGNKYAGKLTGMCGNCDGQANDFKTKNGDDVSGEKQKFNLIGNSHEVPDDSDKPDATCKKPEDMPAELCKAQDRAVVEGADYCGVDKAVDPQLQACVASGKVNVAGWISACSIDLCLHFSDKVVMEALKCTQLAALVELCGQAGFTGIKWRDTYKCPMTCPAGMTYSPEVDPCPASCEDLEAGRGHPSCSQLPKREGCQCADGFVIKSGNTCVSKDTCKVPEITCTNVKGEVIFVVDASSSVGKNNWQLQMGFLQKVVNILEIGPDKVRTSMIVFSTNVKEIFGLPNGSDKTTISSNIQATKYTQGATATGAALKFVFDKILPQTRSGVPVTVILITDGKSNDESLKPKDEAQKIKDAKATIICLGITNDVFAEELNAISSNGQFTHVVNFDKLDEFVHGLARATCEASGGETVVKPDDGTSEVVPPPPPKPERKEPCICSAVGDPHFKTFDGQMLHYFGTCRYTLAKYDGPDCSFNIEVKNEIRGIPGPSYVRFVDVKMFGKTFRLDQNKELLVDGVKTTLPYSDGENIQVFISGLSLQLMSPKCDVQASFNGISNTFVQVSGKYAYELSGICGDCDNDKTNDFRTKAKVDVSGDPNKFNLVGDSYLVTDPSDASIPDNKCSSDPLPPIPEKPCTSAAGIEAVSSSNHCSFEKIEETDLRACFDSGKINMEDWRKSCELDICLNLQGGTDSEIVDSIRCELIEGLMKECRAAGFPVNWREVYNCEIDVSEDCGYDGEYAAEVDPCPLTCEDKMEGKPARSCPNLPKVEGCKCFDNYLPMAAGGCKEDFLCQPNAPGKKSVKKKHKMYKKNNKNKGFKKRN